jgi:GAF domain-containing protein
MKKIKNLSIKFRLPVFIGTASLTVMALICLLLFFPLRRYSLESSSQIAQLSAIDAGERLSATINSAAGVVRAYSGVMTQIISTPLVPREKKRELLLLEMEHLVLADKQLSNIWCSFEPNAVDGKDTLFVNRMGSNSHGYFRPWFANGTITAIEDEKMNTFYAEVKSSRRETITEPYIYNVLGKKRYCISIYIPIIINGKFAGVAGTDFDTAELDEVISGLSGDVSGRLVTPKGNVAVHYDMNRVGLQAEHGNREILDHLAEGRMFDGMFMYEGHEVYKVYTPIHLGEDNAPWFYGVDVPREKIYAQANRMAAFLLILCMAGVALITLAVGMLIRPVTKGVMDVTGIIGQLSQGRINLMLNKHRESDEVGRMKTELTSLVGGLQRTERFAREIGAGNLDAEFQPLSNDDALGNSLVDMCGNLRRADEERRRNRIEEEQRNWTATGLAKFAEILRQDNNDLDALAYNIISNMVKYLNANQGNMFILNEDEHEHFLDLKACYAYERKKFAQGQIKPGEGLVGACYLEGETIYMTDIPDTYITITSGLGNDNPRALLIAPMKINGKVYGVIEIAAFTPFEPYQLAFVERVSESIASAIANVRVSIRTNHLLMQTKEQAEEMANQEEELRQNMEEMQTTQEEMRRREKTLNETLQKMEEAQEAEREKEHEMQQFYRAIFDTFHFVEISPEGNIADINDNALQSFENKDKTQFVGKSMKMFIGEENLNTVLPLMLQGKQHELIIEVPTGAGKTTPFMHKFIPICNMNGELLRVFLVAYAER